MAWPLATFAAIVAGSAIHMSSPLDLNFWPPLICAAIYRIAAAPTLSPLGETIL